jgi:hypothetical protein
MSPRFRDRLEQLEALISPKPPGRVFTLNIDDGPSREEQIAAFKSKMGVTPRDHLIVITFG